MEWTEVRQLFQQEKVKTVAVEGEVLTLGLREKVNGHDTVEHEAQKPTYTTIGWDAYVTCTRCDYTTYVELPALGEATITATLNGTVIETYTVYSMLASRYYVIADISYTYCMWPDVISMGNAVEMSALPLEVFDTDETGFHEEVGRKWFIQQRGNGFYSIHPAYSRNMVLCLLEDGSPVLRHVGAMADDSWYWQIQSGSWGYVIRNYHYNAETLAFSEPDTAYAALISEAYTSSNGAQNWSILSAFDPCGLALFDKSDGDLVANSMDDPSTTRVAYLETSHPKTLGQIGMYVEVMVPIGQSTAYNMSFTSSAFSYNTSTYRITAASTANATATITKTISGTQYSVSFTISAYSQNNTITVLYDNAYMYRHSNALSRINQITQAVGQKFSVAFGKSLTFYTPTPFSSYGDICEVGYDTLCNCRGTNCENASARIYNDNIFMHHICID